MTQHPLSATDDERAAWKVGDRFEVRWPESIYGGRCGTVIGHQSTGMQIESLFQGVLDGDDHAAWKHWYPKDVKRLTDPA